MEWSVESRDAGDGEVELIFNGKAAKGWHSYSTLDKYSAPTVEITAGGTALGDVYDISEPMTDSHGEIIFEGVFSLGLRLRPDGETIKGVLGYTACREGMCTPPLDWEFELLAGTADAVSRQTSPLSHTNDWRLILEAIIWGFLMILTPCVFPMIPMTMSFFMKNSHSPRQGRFKAGMYALFIFLLYTLPIAVITGVTWLIGGAAVPQDIFNWLATHWIPNLLFFIIFIVFALSFFGAFEINLPSALVGKSDKNSDRKGLAGVFFMALTLVLVSFSCTGPIVGTVLIRSTLGEFWTPMLTMAAFAAAFALGFMFFAMFPTLLKSGPWMNSLKIIFGFVELAFALKFLSVADQTYHWQLLDREIYLAIWIAIFSIMTLYLLGIVRFKSEGPSEGLGATRLILAAASLSFVLYMLPGLWGAPLKGLSGFIPPLETQDFVLGYPSSHDAHAQGKTHKPGQGMAALAQGLRGYTSLEEGLGEGRRLGKPVLVDITGYGCVNCREMESKVWSDPKVRRIMAEDYVIVAIFTDDKTKLEEKDWVTLPGGRKLKDVGRVNSEMVARRFGVNGQPNYALLSPEGELLAPVQGYTLDASAFAAFLERGVSAMK